MRISDWSSDVCSSDLREVPRRDRPHHAERLMDREGEFALLVGADLAIDLVERFGVPAHRLDRERDIDVARIRYRLAGIRSDERRVGQECVSTCRSRWTPYD